MATRTEMVNRSLALAGLPPLVSDYSEDSPQANSSRAHWDSDLESLLVETIWNFAKVTDTFEVAAGETHPRYNAVYSINADCLAVWRVNGYENQVYAEGYPVVWEVEGEYLYTSYGECIAEYITRNVNPANFPPKFRDALEHLHAISIGRERGLDANALDSLERAYRLKMAKAKFSDSLEGSGRPIRSNYLAEARKGRVSLDRADTMRN